MGFCATYNARWQAWAVVYK